MVEDVPGFVQLGPADGSLINIHTLKLYLSSIVYVINQYIYIYVIPDIQSHLHSIQVSKMSSKTLWLMIWRLSSSYSPRGLKFCTKLPKCL